MVAAAIDVPRGRVTMAGAVVTHTALANLPARSTSPGDPTGAAAPEPAVLVRDGGKQFDGTWVVRGLDITVERGVIYGLFGPSGSGKTTILRLLLGVLEADEGEVRVLGVNSRRFGRRARARIGYMPQQVVLYPELTVWQNLHMVASLYGLRWPGRRRAMRGVLDLVELWEDRAKRVTALSGGMKRRLQLAAALVHDPELIVIDEPTAGVDPVLRAKFWDRFRELRDAGRTLVVTSEYVTEAEYCDRIGVLGDGRIVASGAPEEVRARAMGGEIVDVAANGLNERLVRALRQLPPVRDVRPVAFDTLRLTVDEAADAIPAILALFGELGLGTPRVEQSRPNFDEIFVRLMEQHRAGSDI
ncbi:MAG: ABC transporter ATP-binding protein [Chloroflexota bacterium]|nr:ABC transporter ATP-binding protein [Chloroflexota bacterium]